MSVRIASVSDLHTDYAENREAVVALAAEIYRRGADVVIVDGDISHRDDRILRGLLAFREVCDVVAYVPGNHDVWYPVANAAEQPELDTWVRYREELAAIASEAGAFYIPSAPLRLGPVAIAGTCGWYDYSLMRPDLRATIGEERIAAKRWGPYMWRDAVLCAFRRADGTVMSDAEVAERMQADLQAQLASLDADASVTDVVVATHHQPFNEVVTRKGELPWDYFNAFMGSAGLGEVIRAASKVRAAIYGHTHVVGHHVVGGIPVYGTPLGYPSERGAAGEADLVRTRIGWLEL